VDRRDDWDQLLDRVRDRDALLQGPAYAGLLRLLTNGGIVPFRSAIEGLTTRERAILQHVLGRDELRLLPPTGDAEIAVAHSPHGKLTLHERDRGDLPESSQVVAALRLPRWLIEMVDEECAADDALEAHEREQLDALLRAWRDDGSLAARLEQVIDWVERVETVLVYVGRRVFSRSDSGSSTLIRDGVLAALRGRSLDEWPWEERLFVTAAQLLFRTGRAVRFEEYNGRQLTAAGLRQRLLRRCCAYLRAAGRADPADLSRMAPAELAALAGDLAPAVDASQRIRYRRINGATYAKDEFLLEWGRDERGHGHLPRLLAELPAAGGDPGDAVRRLAAGALRAGDHALLDRLLRALVLGAVLDTGADYGMSSGVRDIGRLRDGGDGVVGAVLTLRKPDFFCCVLPSPDMERTLPASRTADILWQVAQRMMFNRWHFVPGNFERSEIPAQRHYFFPPLVPDIGEWCDMRHGGHTSARVRYTIRAPGAAMWTLPYLAFGQPYRGCFDIRVVRMDGPPFTLGELRVACQYSALVDAFWREIAAHVEDRDGTAPVFAAYDREWYRQERWRAAS
jgi:hypothetical protein